jgi:hypothetical protein
MNIKNKEEETAIKKLLASGRRDKAMSLLKLKKIREANVKNCQQTYLKLEELVRLPVLSCLCSLRRHLCKQAYRKELLTNPPFCISFSGLGYRECSDEPRDS